MEFLDRWGVTDEILISLCGKPFWEIPVKVPSYYRNKTLYRLHQVLEQVAKNPDCPAETLIKLSKYESWAIKEKVAMNPSTPIEVVEEMTFGMPELSQVHLIKRRPMSTRLARILSHSYFSNVRTMVATESFINGENLQYLLNRDDSSRRWAIMNPNLNSQDLDALFIKWGRDSQYHNCFCLSPNFNPKTMNQLLEDSFALRETFIISNVSALSYEERHIHSPSLIKKLTPENVERFLKDTETLIQKFLNDPNKPPEKYPNREEQLRNYYEPFIRLLKQGLNS